MGRINKGRKNEDNRGMEKNVGKGEGRKVGYRNREKKTMGDKQGGEDRVEKEGKKGEEATRKRNGKWGG